MALAAPVAIFIPPYDAAATHPSAFIFMLVLVPMLLPMTAAVLGVFGFEFLFRKFIIGFGENQLDLATTLQSSVDQAVAATLEREA